MRETKCELLPLTPVYNHSSVDLILGSSPTGRRRMHHGYTEADTISYYSSAFNLLDQKRIIPAPNSKALPIVFLVNENSELPATALALQASGKGAIVSEGNVSDALIISSQRILLDGHLYAANLTQRDRRS